MVKKEDTFKLNSSNGQLYSEWLDEQFDYGIAAPPITGEQAFKFIKQYLLPDDWTIALSVSGAQADCYALDTILRIYSKRYREERKKIEEHPNKKKGLLEKALFWRKI